MTSMDDLLRQVRSLLGTTGTPYAGPAEAHDVYEAYVFALVVAVARRSGASVDFRTVTGEHTNNIVLRKDPGLMHTSTHPYTHAEITFLPNVPPLEAHVGVRVQGKSRVLHECDVLVLPQEEANRCRSGQVAPRTTKALLAVECKFYTSHLKLGLARGFEGLHADLGIRHTMFVSNLPAPRVARYLSHRGRRWEQTVRPGAPQVDHLETLVREAFKFHCARNGVVLA
ncbi:hypothetical protein [Actinoplanes sp. TFC3]|uniref:hypothetical protein n=1 Tax=Actinoplanes sp. TFC3 TaxID=1710355 RepID=UPI00082B1BC6|nr:hypothetical protein [Actinoplanes sp. TFC3]